MDSPRVGVGPGNPFLAGTSGDGFPLLSLALRALVFALKPGSRAYRFSMYWQRVFYHGAAVLETSPHLSGFVTKGWPAKAGEF